MSSLRGLELELTVRKYSSEATKDVSGVLLVLRKGSE